jgi:hypothetical protein
MTQLFHPATIDDREIFKAQWCNRCAKETAQAPCPILSLAMWFSPSDPGYPPQWTIEHGAPRCSAFGNAGTEPPARLPPARKRQAMLDL